MEGWMMKSKRWDKGKKGDRWRDEGEEGQMEG